MSAFVQIVLAELSQQSLLRDLRALLAQCRSATLWPPKTARAASESTTAAKSRNSENTLAASHNLRISGSSTDADDLMRFDPVIAQCNLAVNRISYLL